MDYFQLVCAIGMVLLAMYYYYTSTFDYWKIRGIPGPQPTVLIGNLKDILLRKTSLGDKLRDMYEEYKKEPMFGIFEGMTPILVINDLELIKDVLIKDFPLFVNRGFRLFKKAEPLGEHLFALEAERWRPMRAKLSPVFTSGKLKEMFPLVIECSKNLEKYLDGVSQTGKPVECRDLAGKFTTDVIGSCAFGINMNALSDENSEFREVGKKMFTQTMRMQIRDICRQFLPNIYEIFGHLLQIPGVDQFLIDVVRDTIKYRRENKIVRPDFINTLMELQDHPEKLEDIELTDSLLTSQAFVFFAAGFETSSTTISHALYELALNQHIQDKLRKEIREVCDKHQGALTYEAIKEMKYLDKFFKEVLRMYPLIPFVMREASENYTFKGTKVTIEKGTKLWVPAYGIQRDANIYPEPEKFDPERFNDDAVAARHPMAYLPFGDGPRNCIVPYNMDYFQLLLGIAVILLAIYYYYTSVYDTWKNRGVPGPKPSMFFGNFVDILLKRRAIATIVKDLYNEYRSEPVFGIYEGTSPILVINDLDLIKDVLIRDFSLFVDRGFKVLEKIEPLSQHLFLLEAKRWRPLRAKLSPIFTSGKLKEMFPLIVECAGNLEKYLDKVVEKSVPIVECRDLAAKFTTDVIGSCAFGISTNALEDENSEFRRMGKQIFAPNLKQTIRESCRRLAPFLFKIVGYFLRTTEVNNFFINLVRDTMEYRKTNNITRPDFIYLLMQLKEHPEKMENVELTDSLIAAQAFVFFIAGFETSSSTIAHALYELAQNQEMQDKLRQEIRDAYNKDGGTLTYEGIKGMKYLDKVFKETLRKYPILTVLTRQAMENYTFKGTKITIPKETIVWIPIYGIQHDPNIYSDPEKFDPERFNEDAVAARHPMSYLSFGDGPRNCIGARFAHYQSKVGLATILHNHKVDVCEKTKIPYEADKEAFLLSLSGGVNLKITKA